MNLNKILLPASIALSALGGYSLATQPNEPVTQQEKLEVLLSDKEPEKPLMSKEAAWALTALGLGGLGVFSLSQINGDYKKVRATNKIVNEVLKDQEQKEIVKKRLKLLIDNNNDVRFPQYEQMAESLLSEIKHLQTDMPEKDEAIGILRGILKLNETNMYSQQRSDAVNRELPRLIYLIDKMTSTSEEWETKRNNYPHYENDTNIDEYMKYEYKLESLSIEIHKALENKKLPTFQYNCEEMKKIILQHSTNNDKLFAEALRGLYYLTSDKCARTFMSSTSDADKVRREVNVALEKSIRIRNSKLNQNNVTKNEKREAKNIETEPQKNNVDAGKNKNLKSDINSKITFANVGGQDEAIEKLKKSIMYPLKYPEAFQNRMLNRGLIMYGRPGTGKTLLALALANEAGVNFMKINASDMTASLHGETEKNWRDLFEKARKNQPCIIFIDEFDSVGTQRGHNKVVDYDDKALNQVLALMSDIEKNGDNVFIIGATNRYDIIDSGAKRAGRFGTHIEIKPPQTVKDVIQIFDVHTKDKPISSDINKEDIAKMILDKNLTGADIAAIVNNAYENTYNRLGIYNKMDNGTFTKDDLKDCIISYNDILQAIVNYNPA